MKNAKRFISLALALLLAAGLAFSALGLDAASKSLDINSIEDFIEFTNFCALDSWSKGKTVTLAVNIDLTNYPDLQIASFGGTFDGAGHRISGVNITGAGSNQGLFRYVQSTGTIKDLTVSGTVSPEGYSENVGGIVGVNAGTVQSSSFEGTVSGADKVGGIAGTNAEGGKIIECAVKGTVNGQLMVGGIAGDSAGTVSMCENNAPVCADPTAESLKDIGGIAGHSAGPIQTCTNNSAVGVKSMGYNIGGIVGRQEGAVTGSVNNGAVCGRKDVGGIAGQAEPNITVLLTDDMLAELSTELAKLNTQISSLATSTDTSVTSSIQKKLNSASNYLSTANSSANNLMSEIAGMVSSGGDNNLNTSTQVIYNNLGNYASVFSDLGNVIGKLSAADDQVILAIGSLISAENEDAYSLTTAQTAANGIKTSLNSMDERITALGTHLVSLRNAVYSGNENSMNLSLKDMKADVAGLSEVFSDISVHFSDLKDGLDGLMDSDSERQKTVQDGLNSLKAAFSDMAKSAADTATALDAIEAKTDVNWSSLRTNLNSISAAVKDMSSDNAKKAMDDIAKALDEFETDTTAADPLDKMAQAASSAATNLNTFSNDLTKIQTNVSELATADTTTTTTTPSTGVSSSYNSQSQALYRAIVNLSSEISGISTDLGKDTTSKSTQQAKEINDQMFKVMELMVAAMEDSGSAGSVTDVSEASAEKAVVGKVSGSTNNGPVSGDRDVGGIIGSMAIDSELEPETENGDPFSAEHQYEIMDIVSSCLNNGKVNALIAAGGGIVGRMELGTAMNCENYGSVTGGQYIGGVAGRTVGTVKKSYNKSEVSGDSRVGGIAGYGEKLDSNYAVVVISGSEYVGSIAGQADAGSETIKNNIFLSNGTGAVDGVSYAGVAEPMDIADLKKRNGLPAGFSTFTVTCMAGDEVVGTVEADYRTLLSDIELPQVPEKDGKKGRWSDFTMDRMLLDQTVHAVYDENYTVISSKELDAGRAFALAEGQFTRFAVLHVYDSETAPPSGNAWAVWDVLLEDEGVAADTVTNIRLLNQSGSDATVWQYTDEQWVEVQGVSRGQYITVTMKGTKGTFCMRPDYTMVIILGVIIAAAAAAAVTAIVIIMRKRAKKKPPKVKNSRRRRPAPEPETEDRPMYLSPEFTESVTPKPESERSPYDDEPTIAAMEQENPLIAHASQELEKWRDIMDVEEDESMLTPKEKRARRKQAKVEARQEKQAMKNASKQAEADAKAAAKQAKLDEKNAAKQAKIDAKNAAKQAKLDEKAAIKQAKADAKQAKIEARAEKRGDRQK